MKGVVSPELRKILNNPELRIKFFKDYFGVQFINPPRNKNPQPKPKRRNILDILFGK